MKKNYLIVIILFLFLSVSKSNAQDAVELENSVLWKVERSDLKEPSYLLGTLHLMCEKDFKILDKIRRTLDSVDALVLEINLSDPNELKSMQELMKATKPISEELSKEEFDKLDVMLKDKFGLPLQQFDNYGLSTLYFFLVSKMLPSQSLKSLDVELQKLAVQKKIDVLALETVSQQMNFLKKAMPADYLLKQIMLFDSYKKDMIKSIELYLKEDLKSVAALLSKEEYMNENATEWMLTRRNNNWIEAMPSMIKSRSTLFAVGAAHLVNKNGLIYLLRQKGYTVTPVLK